MITRREARRRAWDKVMQEAATHPHEGMFGYFPDDEQRQEFVLAWGSDPDKIPRYEPIVESPGEPPVVCGDCGVVVVDTSAHDRFHREIQSMKSQLGFGWQGRRY